MNKNEFKEAYTEEFYVCTMCGEPTPDGTGSGPKDAGPELDEECAHCRPEKSMNNN